VPRELFSIYGNFTAILTVVGVTGWRQSIFTTDAVSTADRIGYGGAVTQAFSAAFVGRAAPGMPTRSCGGRLREWHAFHAAAIAVPWMGFDGRRFQNCMAGGHLVLGDFCGLTLLTMPFSQRHLLFFVSPW